MWISPNGYLSFAPGVPCDCCYNGLNCGIETQQYQALAGGYVTDLVYILDLCSLFHRILFIPTFPLFLMDGQIIHL